MPYTPPSHRSPASSAPASPDASRRPSLTHSLSGSRPALPRSTSYLNKHRRTPSVTTVNTVGDGSVGSLTPQGTSDNFQAMAFIASSGTIRQSPPPVTDDRGMPMGAVISPPDSASSGSDDESCPEIRGRKYDRLKDLKFAVSQIPQTRTPSPPPKDVPNVTSQHQEHARMEPPPSRGMHISFSTSALGDLSNHRRKISHVRSATEPNAGLADSSSTASEEDTDEDLRNKPQMVRKKSGELVRPALRPPSRRRPSSMPGTPVFSKAVHFDSHLEHVRHFLQVDRPLAVSASSSPIDSYESDNEYPFPSEEKAPKGPPYEWDILTPNFPHDNHTRKTLPIKLEKVWLSPDQKFMIASVAVANLAFQKHISCRFTMDYWKTTSEVIAEYSHEIRPQEGPVSYDRFNFSIKLADTANLESKTLFFCVRYAVNGQEFWDNNAGANFQVDFRKKHLPQNGKNNFQGASNKPRNGLPRSNRRQSSLRPKSMPLAFEEFGDEPRFSFDQSINEYLGESGSGPNGLRFKSKSSNNVACDNITKGLSPPSGVAFANRYDFGASLTAAVQAAKDTMGKDKDGLYMKNNVRPSTFTAEVGPSGVDSPNFAAARPQPSPGNNSPIPSLPSASYEELVNRYCFFGSKPQVSVKDENMKGGRFDGASGMEENSKKVAADVNVTNGVAREQAARLSIRTHEAVGCYFTSGASGASPINSPLTNYIVMGEGSRASTPKSLVATQSPLTGPQSSDLAYRAQQPELAERFLWMGDSHTAPVISG